MRSYCLSAMLFACFTCLGLLVSSYNRPFVNLIQEKPEVASRLAQEIRAWRSQHPMAGTRGTLVAHPGWVAPLDWAEAVVPASLLQPRWRNELPFPKALLDATAGRGVLVDEATRQQLLEAEAERAKAWQD